MMKRLLVIILLLAGLHTCVAQAPSGRQTIAEQVRGTDSTSTGFVADVLTWYDAHMNYTTVGLLMALESSFVPFPSEVVIPPAVYVASNPDSRSGMTLWLIVLVGTLGALIGAYINYFLSRWLGRPIIYAFAESKVGHLLGLSKEKMQRAEVYFNEHGSISTLVGRLIPVIRQLISIPAGLSKMNLATFSLFTFLGAGVWNCVLALLGWLAYHAADPSVIEKYSHQLSVGIVVVFVAVVAFLVVKAVVRKRKEGKE
jgi:membrane protein DedA with SNARE-associated domain